MPVTSADVYAGLGNYQAARDTSKQNLSAFEKTRKNPLDYYAQQEKELGVGDVRGRVGGLRKAVGNTEALLEGVGASVAGRTSGSNVTEAQRSRLVGLERQPHEQAFGKQQRALGEEQMTLQELLGQVGQRSGMMYQSQQDKERALQSSYERALGEYNSQQDLAMKLRAFEAEQAAQERAYQLEQQKLAEARRAAAASMATPSWASALQKQLGGGGGGGGASGGMQQQAANEIEAMYKSGDQARIRREIAAINQSAAYGNQKDKMKLEYIGRRPGGSGSVSINALANGGSLRF
jgi:hypothetical protein